MVCLVCRLMYIVRVMFLSFDISLECILSGRPLHESEAGSRASLPPPLNSKGPESVSSMVPSPLRLNEKHRSNGYACQNREWSRRHLSLVDPPLGVLLELVDTPASVSHLHITDVDDDLLGEPKSNLLLSVLNGVGSVADVLNCQLILAHQRETRTIPTWRA